MCMWVSQQQQWSQDMAAYTFVVLRSCLASFHAYPHRFNAVELCNCYWGLGLIVGAVLVPFLPACLPG